MTVLLPKLIPASAFFKTCLDLWVAIQKRFFDEVFALEGEDNDDEALEDGLNCNVFEHSLVK